ncbi:MAG: DUF898 domain-containing protein [Nitrospinae bacterium]|nr:DUF898 domain-containing protein [Nitrospinota bacterium]MBL7020351.1 DUF898 domain-containing protein [Nitrospinaceae bacterium]
MSYQITLSTWSGASKTEAAEKLAKVFQLGNEKSVAIVDHLCQGLPWRFDQCIPDHQADTASTYLRSLGFAVDIQPVEGEIEPLSDSVVMAEAPDKEEVSIPEDNYRFKFQGDGRTLLNISFVNLIKTVFTLGIYRFWAKTNVRQYIWSQTLFAGDRFSYHGTGKELLSGAFRFGGVIVLLGLINVYIFFNIGPAEGEMFSDLLSLVFVVMIPALLVGAWRYRLSRTAWRNIRFSFRGKRMDAVHLYVVWGVLSVLTLGLYWPFFKMKSEKFWRENSWFGDVQFGFSGMGKDFFGKFILAVLLTPLTLGFYLFWFTADLKRYLWSHTHVGGATFHFPIKGKDYMKLKVTNFFIFLFTLGVGFPWVVVRNQKFVTDNLVLAGNIELNQIVQEMKTSGAFGEEALDAMDFPIDIG